MDHLEQLSQTLTRSSIQALLLKRVLDPLAKRFLHFLFKEVGKFAALCSNPSTFAHAFSSVR